MIQSFRGLRNVQKLHSAGRGSGPKRAEDQQLHRPVPLDAMEAGDLSGLRRPDRRERRGRVPTGDRELRLLAPCAAEGERLAGSIGKVVPPNFHHPGLKIPIPAKLDAFAKGVVAVHVVCYHHDRHVVDDLELAICDAPVDKSLLHHSHQHRSKPDCAAPAPSRLM